MPDEIFFKLPDSKMETWIRTIRHGDGIQSTYSVGSGHHKLSHWTTSKTETRISPAMVNDDRARHSRVLRLELLPSSIIASSHPSESEDQAEYLTTAWVSIYALWLHPDYREEDLIAISVNKERVGEYLRNTGLGMISPFPSDATTAATTTEDVVFWITREAFWQGAGAPNSLHWLQCRPEVNSFPGFNGTLGVFPSQQAFTHKGNVCTVHPLRPAKPEPGAIIYSRFIVELGQQLRIRHIDAEDALHFEAYKRWQNSDRVNASWQERGSDAHHQKYLKEQLADPHTISCLFEWDGELAGYTELGWVMEDNAACFMGSNCNIVVGEHDQNSHILVGEERFRGGKRYQAVATSIKHCCFLRDPRTKQVIAEPRADLSHVQIQDKFLPQEKKKRTHLPHKTAMLFALQRDRFFQEAHFV